jgi:diguanylate cyclase (GGDEF)-like protein/PAS domain S-box-containing protein
MGQGAADLSMNPSRSDTGESGTTGHGHFLTERLQRRLSSSDDPRQVLRMGRYLTAAGTSLFAIVLLFACYLYGVLPGDAFVQIAVFTLLAILAFFVAFHFGLNLRAADPSLTLPQMCTATVVILYAMFRAEGGSAVYVTLLLMAYLFGVLRLSTRSLLIYAVFVLAGYGGVIALRWQFRPDAYELSLDLLQWAVLALTLPWFGLMGGYVSGLRHRLRKSNTELEKALLAAKASQKSLSEAQRMAQVGSWAFDPGRSGATWSPETYRIFGLDPSDPAPVGESFRQRIHPEDLPRYLELLGPALKEGRGFDTEYRIVQPDGDLRWVHSVAECVLDEQGKTILLRGTVSDITDRKVQADAITLARDEAAGARATLIDAIESLNDAFALFDASDRLILCNRKYAQLLTGSERPETIAGKSFEQLVRDSVARNELIEAKYAGNVEAWVAERVRRHRNPGPETPDLQLVDGRWFQIIERRTQSGGIVGVRRDVTQRKLLEQRQSMEHAVTRLLAESETVAEAMPKIIQTICETLGWDCGARWRWDEQAGVLRCAETWSVAAAEVREFMEASSKHNFAPSSTGLIRRAWSAREPIWVADVSKDPGFQRAPLATKAGLRAAFAFPIQSGTQLEGVMEFFLRDAREPDRSLLLVSRSIGMQIGQFIARKAAQEQIRQLAHFDFLSGLPNRTLFHQLVAHAITKAQRRGTSLALLFIDLDRFKDINDSFGHDAGDHLLATFAQRLRDCLRKSDLPARLSNAGTPARFGGDEFVVVIDDYSDPADLATVAQKILAAAREPVDLAGVKGRVTASVGIAVYPGDGKDLDELFKNADTAMYAAKQTGGNSFRFFSAPPPTRRELVG